MEWSWPQVLGVVVGIGLVVGLVGKFIIGDWLEKSKELANLKSTLTKTALKRLEEDINKFEAQVSTVKHEMRDLTTRIGASDKKIGELNDKIDVTLREMHGMALQIKAHVNEVVKSELIALSAKATLFKGTKNGK